MIQVSLYRSRGAMFVACDSFIWGLTASSLAVCAHTAISVVIRGKGGALLFFLVA